MTTIISPLSSDQDLHNRVTDVLRNNPYLSGATVRLESHEGHVTLRGHVGSFFAKQMAQESLRRVDGIDAIDNKLEVAS